MKLNCNSFFDEDFEYLNLNQFYLENKDKIKDTKDPSQIQSALDFLGKNNTYGGYGEDRKDIWKGTYMDETKNYIHLGIDINVKSGTPIKCPFDAKCVDIFTDTDEKIGWGGRMILISNEYSPYLVLGHINPKSFNIKNSFVKDEIIGKVGTWPTNGNTFNHLHVQTIYNIDWNNFDGYGNLNDLKNNPNPFEIDF